MKGAGITSEIPNAICKYLTDHGHMSGRDLASDLGITEVDIDMAYSWELSEACADDRQMRWGICLPAEVLSGISPDIGWYAVIR